MKLQRFVIGFILGSSLTVLVAGLWFHRPALNGTDSAKPVSAAAPAVTAPSAASAASRNPLMPPLSSSPSDSVLAAKR